jgi:hypothetical protein
VHPGALEACNHIDDDCNGIVDDAARPEGVPSIVLTRAELDTSLSWAPVRSATGYDVVRGDLTALRQSRGNFSSSTDVCLADDAPASDLLDRSVPSDGEGFWYLVRPTSCVGSGSFDGGGQGQLGSRDPGIEASPSGCR